MKSDKAAYMVENQERAWLRVGVRPQAQREKRYLSL